MCLLFIPHFNHLILHILYITCCPGQIVLDVLNAQLAYEGQNASAVSLTPSYKIQMFNPKNITYNIIKKSCLVGHFDTRTARVNKQVIHLYTNASTQVVYPFVKFDACLPQRGHAPVNIVEGGLAGLASVQMCQRESRASGSRPTEWRSRGQPNSHLCIVCHALVVQVLTCGTRPGFSVCHKYTVTCSYTVA